MHTLKKEGLGYPRPYLRDGVPGMSLERQREMLRTAGVDVTDDRMLYVDRLTKAAVKAREPGSLKDRDDALRPRRPGESIIVAGFRVIGWTTSDRARAVAEAGRHNANIYCVDIDRVYSAETPMPELLDALASAEEADRRGTAIEKQSRATDASQKARLRKKLKKLAIARPKWHDRSFTVDQISEECGLSRRTLYNELGPRWENDAGVQHA